MLDSQLKTCLEKASSNYVPVRDIKKIQNLKFTNLRGAKCLL